jgi:hypothetical protein
MATRAYRTSASVAALKNTNVTLLLHPAANIDSCTYSSTLFQS